MNRFTRFEQTFDNKARAILKLDNTARDYGEIVAIRYKNEVKEVKTLLAFYQSTNKGDYTIMHDTAETKREDGKAKIFSVLRRPGESDKECIARATFGIEEDLSDGDMVIIKTPNADDAIYLYFEHGWIGITKGTIVRTKDTESIKLTTTWDEEQGCDVISGTVLLINGGRLTDL